jgi:hypothetical protein
MKTNDDPRNVKIKKKIEKIGLLKIREPIENINTDIFTK